MVVVELFTADDDAPRDDVGRRILAGEIAITPIMAESVDDAGCRDGNP